MKERDLIFVDAATPDGAVQAGDESAFLAHLRVAGELVGARRLPEAEVEILRSLTLIPQDLRALKLLALIRFKLGRLAEAREVYRTALEVAPDDPAARLNLGLIALKLDWFEEAVSELELATRARPNDTRAWSYLGYAYARTGSVANAVAAFRRSGQHDVAAEIERGGKPGDSPATTTTALVKSNPSLGVPSGLAPPVEPESLTAFAFSRLLPTDGSVVELAVTAEGVLKVPVRGEVHVRETALMACTGEVNVDRAKRRERGRMTNETLGETGATFFACRGSGAVWLSGPPSGRGLIALALEDDVVYLREDRVVAFDQDLAWEWGRIPWDGLPLLQFRGSGRLVVESGQAEVVAMRVTPGAPVAVPRSRLLGWVGRVVAQSVREPGQAPIAPHIACEGEGVLLLSKHGDLAQPIYERAQPGHDGPGAPDPGRPRLHR